MTVLLKSRRGQKKRQEGRLTIKKYTDHSCEDYDHYGTDHGNHRVWIEEVIRETGTISRQTQRDVMALQYVVPFVNAIAYADTEAKLEVALDRLENFSTLVHRYVIDAGLEKISIVRFTGATYGHHTNNVAESTNSMLRHVRSDGPLSLTLDFVHRFTVRSADRVEHLSSRTGFLLEEAERHLDAVQLKARGMTVDFSARFKAHVRCFPRDEVVDLELKTCSCMIPAHHHWPCAHMVAVISNLPPQLRMMPQSFFAECYERSICVRGHTFPIHFASAGALVHQTNLRPPVLVVSRGRPRTLRMRGNMDAPSTSKCSICKEIGHNKRTCTQSVLTNL